MRWSLVPDDASCPNVTSGVAIQTAWNEGVKLADAERPKPEKPAPRKRR